MLREKGIMIYGSEEASFFRRLYRIPCVGFSPFGWEHGLVYYYLLENCGATASTAVTFRMRGLYRDKSQTLIFIRWHLKNKYCSDIFLLSCLAALSENYRERSVRIGPLRIVSIISWPILTLISHKIWPRQCNRDIPWIECIFAVQGYRSSYLNEKGL